MKTLLTLIVLAISFTLCDAQTLTADRVNLNVPAVGAQKVVKVGGYGANYFSYDFGTPHHDDVLCIGWNCGGPEYDPLLVQWSAAFESYYTTSEGRTQSEFYLTGGLPNGGLSTRPFAIDFYHDDGSTMVGIYSKSFVIASPATNSPWIRFSSTPVSGWVNLTGDSKIDFTGNTNPYYLTVNGRGLIGKDGNTFKLFTGGLTGETLQLFEGSSVGYNNPPMTIKVGSNAGGFQVDNSFRWSVTGPYAGYSNIQTAFDVDTGSTANKIVKRGSSGEINTSSVKVNGLQVVGSRCGAITDSNGTDADNQRAINSLLACFRVTGAIAQ